MSVDFSTGGMSGLVGGTGPHSALIASIAVAPSQWRDMYARKVFTGEERLCEAILENALHALRLGSAVASRESVTWIEAHPGPFPAFTTCCEVLGLDPDYIRQGLQAIYKRRAWGEAVPKPRGQRRRVVKYSGDRIGSRGDQRRRRA